MKALTMNGDGKIIDPDTGEEVNRENIQSVVENANNNQSDNKQQNNKQTDENKIKSPEKPKIYTKYEVTPDSVFYIKFGIVPKDGRIIVIPEDDVDFEKNAEAHWVKFKMWTYEQELEWKNQATEYDSIKRIHALNSDKLNEIKLRNLLVSWSFGEKEDSLKLFHIGGLLTDESLKTFYSLYPVVVRYIVECMNDVLEFNN